MRLIPGRRSRAGGVNCSPRSILIKRSRRARARSARTLRSCRRRRRRRSRTRRSTGSMPPLHLRRSERRRGSVRVRPAMLLPLAGAPAWPPPRPEDGAKADERLAGTNGGVTVGVEECVHRELDASRIVVRAERAGRGAPHGRLLVPRSASERVRQPLAADPPKDSAAAPAPAQPRPRASARAPRACSGSESAATPKHDATRTDSISERSASANTGSASAPKATSAS